MFYYCQGMGAGDETIPICKELEDIVHATGMTARHSAISESIADTNVSETIPTQPAKATYETEPIPGQLIDSESHEHQAVGVPEYVHCVRKMGIYCPCR